MPQLVSSIENLKRRKRDVDSYAFVMDRFRLIDVSADVAFQRKFTHFYRIRRNASWRETFYRLLESNKNNSALTFEYILKSIYDATGRIEASFSSKLLATVNPDMPIWDSIVLSKLHIKPCHNTDKQYRLRQTVEIYNTITSWYAHFLQTEAAQEFVQEFDVAFPEYAGFSKMKKVDFLIWSSGDADPFAIV